MTHARPATPWRKVLVGTAAAAAAVIAVASAAFACTVFNGTLKVTANSTNTTVTGVAKGNNTMDHCAGSPSGSAQIDDADRAGTVTIVVEPATCGSASTQLASGLYAVTWISEWAMDCMLGKAGVLLGTIDVDSSGNTTGTAASRTFTIPAAATSTGGIPNDQARICVTSTTQGGVQQGNAVPITII